MAFYQIEDVRGDDFLQNRRFYKSLKVEYKTGLPDIPVKKVNYTVLGGPFPIMMKR